MLGVIMGRVGTQELGATFWGQTELSCYDDVSHLHSEGKVPVCSTKRSHLVPKTRNASVLGEIGIYSELAQLERGAADARDILNCTSLLPTRSLGLQEEDIIPDEMWTTCVFEQKTQNEDLQSPSLGEGRAVLESQAALTGSLGLQEEDIIPDEMWTTGVFKQKTQNEDLQSPSLGEGRAVLESQAALNSLCQEVLGQQHTLLEKVVTILNILTNQGLLRGNEFSKSCDTLDESHTCTQRIPHSHPANPTVVPCECHTCTLRMPHSHPANATLAPCESHTCTQRIPHSHPANGTVVPCECHTCTLRMPHLHPANPEMHHVETPKTTHLHSTETLLRNMEHKSEHCHLAVDTVYCAILNLMVKRKKNSIVQAQKKKEEFLAQQKHDKIESHVRAIVAMYECNVEKERPAYTSTTRTDAAGGGRKLQAITPPTTLSLSSTCIEKAIRTKQKNANLFVYIQHFQDLQLRKSRAALPKAVV